ncbi:hypothetical protein ACHAWO_013257 [Cyclotella atomus]|jgi:hypothetical protein|uniref:Uncharacterized protein n=1 Tax=Cyclotella atomus TaxID=382360 RepID=A0ABD3QRV1_9STRA
MPSKYPELASDHEITEKLHEMGIDVLEPQTRFEETMADAMREFSSFVLSTGKEKCLDILENDLYNEEGSVGELQGGDDSFSIYRVSFPDEVESTNKKCKNAAAKLLQEFNEYSQQTRRHANTLLTFDNIKQYMLGMCDRRTAEPCSVQYTSLGNLMFILCFGEAAGQVRHIDNMVPNLQICLYMSESCPSTIVYEMDDGEGPPVTDVQSLLDLWNREHNAIPQLIRDILLKHGDVPLTSKWYTKYFSFWKTINLQLLCFGKLYQPVLHQLSLETNPGTTMLAGGNEVHAGPPTNAPRMFAFAVGIPDANGIDGLDAINGNTTYEDDGNDGEVQYSPVLLHIDFCCILFTLLDDHCDTAIPETIEEAKRFLVSILVDLIRDYPMQEYLRQIHESRRGTRDWLEKVLYLVDQNASVDSLVNDAIQSDVIFYSPDVVKMNSKKKRKGRNKAIRSKS